MSRAMHNGDVRIDRSGRFDGMVNGTLTVAAGLEVEMAGMVNGTLVVQHGARVIVTGMVNGDVVERGAHTDRPEGFSG